jgi:hypothetical protein
MLSLKTTTLAALIAALSVIATASVAGAFIPQAFAQENDDDNGGTTVDVTQSNSKEITISQSQGQFAEAETGDDGTAIVEQSASQGFCLQDIQQNAAAGGSASNSAFNTNTGSVSNSSFSTGTDCS